MNLASLFSVPRTPSTTDSPRPHDDELDLFGLTHQGLVRQENQDHFLLGTINPQVFVHATSLPHSDRISQHGERMATLMLVADGVGGTAAGSDASRLATEAVTQYVMSAVQTCHASGNAGQEQFMAELREAAIGAHTAVREQAAKQLGGKDSATTLSLGIVVWPWLYVLQVGDSRCYMFRNDALEQITRDQTVAQDLVDQGVLAQARAHESPLSHVLSSAIGATDAMPVVTQVDVRPIGSVILVCSDGLTKHVSDDEIAEHLRQMTSSEQVCKALLQLTLDRGASDNITLVIGRALRHE